MRLLGDTTLLARVYCGLAAAALIGLGLSSLKADRLNPYLGAILCGVGFFLVAGLFGKPTRVLALLALCVCFFGLAFVIGSVTQLFHGVVPGLSTLSLWAVEVAAAAVALLLARRMYRAQTA